MKHILAGLLLALTPAVAVSETTGQELIVSDLQDIGVLIIGHTSGCGEADYEAIESKVSALSAVYKALDEEGLSNESLKVLIKSELVHGANVGERVIREKGCFTFNSYIIDHRFDMNTVEDVFSLYIPTSGV